MKLLISALVVDYLVMAPFFFRSWIELFDKEPSMSSEDRLLSKVILVVATILWPVVVPIAYLELLKTQKLNGVDVTVIDSSISLRPLLISIFLSSWLTISGLAAIAYMFAYHNS